MRKLIGLLGVMMAIVMFSAFHVLAASEIENNDTPSTATKIGVNTVVSGASFNEDDEDWYVFTLSENGSVSIEINHTLYKNYSGSWWVVALYSKTNTTTCMANWYVSGDENKITEGVGLPTGVYYISVKPYNGYYAPPGEEYTLKLNYTKSNVWEKEWNDTVKTANTIALNTVYYGASFNEDDEDWYVFTLSENGSVSIEINHTLYKNYSGSWWVVALYSKTNTTTCMANWYVSGDENKITEGVGLPAGVYYISVKPYNGYYAPPGEEYNIKVSVPQPSIKLDYNQVSVISGKQLYLDATVTGSYESPVWRSSNTNIATVNQYGVVTGKQAGTAIISATIAGNKTAKCRVQVLYKDVTSSSKFWFEPTNYLTNKNVVKGYSKQTKFKPSNECTRAQMLTFMWRLAGSPNPRTKTCKFKDVKKSDYFYKPVLWAVENGITTGYKGGKFKPKNVCTRAQTVTFLWRMAGEPSPDYWECKFSDVKESAYYYEATIWASEKQIVAGYKNGTFKPKGKCLRRQMVTFLYKYDKYVNGKG